MAMIRSLLFPGYRAPNGSFAAFRLASHDAASTGAAEAAAFDLSTLEML